MKYDLIVILIALIGTVLVGIHLYNNGQIAGVFTAVFVFHVYLILLVNRLYCGPTANNSTLALLRVLGV